VSPACGSNEPVDAWIWRAVTDLIRHGVPNAVIKGFLPNEEYDIAEKTFDGSANRPPEEYAERTVSRAYAYISDKLGWTLLDDAEWLEVNKRAAVTYCLSKLSSPLVKKIAGWLKKLGEIEDQLIRLPNWCFLGTVQRTRRITGKLKKQAPTTTGA
jgi:hypothetical protein